MRTSEEGRNKLKKREGLRLFSYPDPVSKLAKAFPRAPWGKMPARKILESIAPDKRNLSAVPWTIGYGQTKDITIDSVMTLEEAEDDLSRHLVRYENLVLSACTVVPTQEQFDALVSLAWNCEIAVGKASSIIKAHNRSDWESAARAFELYCKSGGRVEPALLKRRKDEAFDYLAGSPVATSVSLADLAPQTVDVEKPMLSSKINIAQIGTGAIAGIGGVNEALNAVTQFKEGVAGLGTWLVPMACIAIVVLCGFTIWQRYDLRKRGIV